MKKFPLIIFFLTLYQLCFAQTSLPPGYLKSLSGKEVKILDVISPGKPIVISFWATWCNPCVEELEAVAQLYETWQGEIDFEFVAISIDDSRSAAKVKSFVQGKGWPFKVLLDQNQDAMKAMNVSLVPFTFILNSAGVVKYRHSGYINGDEQTLFKELKKISNE